MSDYVNLLPGIWMIGTLVFNGLSSSFENKLISQQQLNSFKDNSVT